MSGAPEVTFIGGGVYASYADGQIRLHNAKNRHWVALDAATFFNLIAYAKRVWPPPEEVARKRMLQDRHEGD